MKSRTLEIDYQLDNPELGAKCLGMILLSTDLTLERDIRRVIQDSSVAAYINRVTYNNPMTIESLAALEANLKQAAIDLLPGAKLDAVAFACTSASIAIGPDTVLLQLEEGQPGVPSTTPISAALDAFKIMEVSKIALLTPYHDKINQPIHSYIEENNVEVMSISTFDMDSDIDVARIPLEAIIDAAKIADHNDAQAVFLSCTALRSMECIDALEKSLGKPVLSSNQVMLWRLLRLAGWENKIHGFGRLLAEK